MKRNCLHLALAVCVSGSLQAQIHPPKIGTARLNDGTVRIVYGLPGNYVLDNKSLGFADVVSFSNSGGLVAQDGFIELLAPDHSTIASYRIEDKLPVLNIDGSLTTAVAWLPHARTLVRWDGRSFCETPVNDPELRSSVSAVRLRNQHTAELLLSGTDGSVSEATVSTETGSVISVRPLPGVQAPAFWQHSYLVYPGKGGLEIQDVSGIGQTVFMPAENLAFERISSDNVHLTASNKHWILHLGTGAIEISELPAQAPQHSITAAIAGQEPNE